nr:uncharacterized mitochondrial protein AtMg00810-like [Tanacetum cinerariifolium]
MLFTTGRTISSPNRPTFNNEDAFSFNFPNYFPATPGNTSPDSSNDLTKYLLATLVFSPLHDDLYMEVMLAYDATNELPIPPLQALIASPTVMPPVLSLFDSRDFLPLEEISPLKDAETPVESSIPISSSSSVGSSSPVRMPPKKTSTSAAPAMTQAAIRNTTNNDNNNYPNNRDNNNYPNDRNSKNHSNNHNNNKYQDNRNNDNRNNDYHHQQNRRQETVKTYAATPTKNKRGTIDQTLFIRRQRKDFILVQVYVDDIIFDSLNPQLCREFEALMHEKFYMSAMGELNFFFGLQVLQKEDGIFLSHDKYIGDILKKFGFSDVRSSNTPMDKENPWGKDGIGKDVDLHLYRSMIGSLMYLIASKPNIMFAVCACARHQVIPKECHLHAVKRIFRYLKGHPKLGLWYPKASPFDLVAFSDSDYGGASQDRKSTIGGSQFLGKRIHTAKTFDLVWIWLGGDYGNVFINGFSWDSVLNGEGSGTPTEPHYTPSPEADTSHPITSSIPLPSIPTAPITPVTQPVTTPIRQYSRRARIAQSSALPTVADEPTSPVKNVNEGEACPTESGFIAAQDRATIAKSSTLPHDSAPRVTSPAADEGSVAAKQSGDDAPIKGRSINEREAAAERISNDSEDIARVLTFMDAAIVLAGGIDVPTGSGSIPTAGSPATVISTGSEVGPTASSIVGPTAKFLENKAIEQGVGPNWLFDIDSLTKSMNYMPVDAGTNSTNLSVSLMKKAALKFLKAVETRIPLLLHSIPLADQMETLTVESPIPTVSSPVLTACLNDSSKTSSEARLVSKRVTNQEQTPSLNNILSLTNSLQRQHSELLAKFQAQEVEILRLKERVQVLEDREGVTAKQFGYDAPIKGRSINEGEAAAERISNDSEDIARVLTLMDTATVLAGGINVPTGSGSIPTAGLPATVISTGSEVGPTASPIVASYSRRKGKEVMVKSDTLKK